MLFLLKRIDEGDSWSTGTFSIVVRASSEKHARQIAFDSESDRASMPNWLSESEAAVVAIDLNGPPGIICAEYVA